MNYFLKSIGLAQLLLVSFLFLGCQRNTVESTYWRDTFPQYKYTKIAGVDTRYDVVGQGPAILLVHGLGASYDMFSEVIPQLAKNHTVYMVDLRGMGYSARPNNLSYSYYSQIFHIQEFMRQFNLKDVCIWGHSIGGFISFGLAMQNQDRVRCLIVSDMPYGFRSFPNPLFDLMVTPGVGKMGEWMTQKWMVRDILKDVFYDDKKFVTKERLNLWYDVVTRRGGIAAIRDFLGTLPFDEADQIESTYKQLNVPTLVLWGEKDEWFSPESGKKLAGSLPNGEFKMISNAGHQSMEENPTEAAAFALEFLSKIHAN